MFPEQYNFRWGPEKFDIWRAQNGFKLPEGVTNFDHNRHFNTETYASAGWRMPNMGSHVPPHHPIHQRQAALQEAAAKAAVAMARKQLMYGTPEKGTPLQIKRRKSTSDIMDRPQTDDGGAPKPSPSYVRGQSSFGIWACLRRDDI